MNPRVLDGLGGLRAASGEFLGESGWHSITQARIDLFAEATEDHQWIHTDPKRAALGPFGTTIAHGYLSLALLPNLGSEIYRVENVSFGLNYGANRIRFPAPLASGSDVRASAVLLATADVNLGVQATIEYTLEARGVSKPVCVAEVIFIFGLRHDAAGE